MNKKVVVVLVLAGLVFSSSADLTKFRYNNTIAGTLKNNSNIDISATILTYRSVDNVINFDPFNPLSATYGNDTFYMAVANLASGRFNSSYMIETVNDYRGQYVYAIVLDMPLATFNTTYGGNVANVPLLTWYGITTVFGPLANMDIVPPPTAQSFVPTALVTSSQVIPEPATALLFGIGAMGAWMVRRNKLKSKEQADA